MGRKESNQTNHHFSCKHTAVVQYGHSKEAWKETVNSAKADLYEPTHIYSIVRVLAKYGTRERLGPNFQPLILIDVTIVKRVALA